MDHQRVAEDLVYRWTCGKRKWVLDRLRRMFRWDALACLARFLDYAGVPEGDELREAIERRASRRSLTASPIECRHERTLFVQSSDGGPPHRSEHVTVCADCGQFRVSAEQDGVRIVTTFELPTWPLVEAAGRYAWHLEAEEGP